MRLTLRTLLAYLDDVLEPSETKLIGQKIQESAVAGKLISLIRLVVRQRRLKAPSVSGPNIGIDPNVVAQYLDNTLPPEQVVEVEKVLLTSDELLAEVASCHQVLALVMGKPVEVSEASRERLYALGPVAKSEQLRVDEAPSADGALVAAAARDAERVNGSVQPPAPPVPEIPEYLRQTSWSKRVVPAAIAAVLVLVCAGLLYLDPSLMPALRQARLATNDRDSGKAGQISTPDSATPLPSKNTDGAETSGQLALSNAGSVSDLPSQSGDIPPGPAMSNGIDPTPTPDEPESPKVANVKPATPVVAPNGVDAPVDASVAGKGSAPGVPIPNPPPTGGGDQPAVRTPLAVQYISNEGVVLRLDESKQHWFQLPRRSAVSPGEVLAVPEPFEAQLDFDHGTIFATVIGDSALRILNPNRVTASGIGVHRGRILLRAAQKELQNRAFSIAVGGDTWVLEFQSPDTVCTIEIEPREPVQFEKPFDQNWYQGVLRVLQGSVKWTTSDGQVQLVAAQTALDIAPPAAGPAVKPVSSGFVPDWTDAQKRKQAPLRRFAATFEKQFELDQPIEQSLLVLIRDKNAKTSELAIRSLGLIESYAALAQALAECDFEEGRFAARDGIRAWLGRQADRGPLLRAALESHFPLPEASAVYILLWGFRPDDGTNRATSVELATWLRNSHVAVRELAYYWIVQLTNRKWEFRAIDVQSRREAAVRKIDAHVLKDGALVKPAVPEPAP